MTRLTLTVFVLALATTAAQAGPIRWTYYSPYTERDIPGVANVKIWGDPASRHPVGTKNPSTTGLTASECLRITLRRSRGHTSIVRATSTSTILQSRSPIWSLANLASFSCRWPSGLRGTRMMSSLRNSHLRRVSPWVATYTPSRTTTTPTSRSRSHRQFLSLRR